MEEVKAELQVSLPPEIKDKNPQFLYNLYSSCSSSHTISRSPVKLATSPLRHVQYQDRMCWPQVTQQRLAKEKAQAEVNSFIYLRACYAMSGAGLLQSAHCLRA
eukprot:2140399-Rhodomonas_salina.1